MKITDISLQVRNNNRVNLFVDGKYRFSLDFYQINELGLKVGLEFSELELLKFEQESLFGKIYSRSLEYCLMRPRSEREMHDYLYRKSRPVRDKTGELSKGISADIITRVFDRLVEKKYIDDLKFAKYWVENRSMTKGISFRKLKSELFLKGISNSIIEQVLNETERSEESELQKIVNKKRSRYPDDKKFMIYLVRLGFSYDDVKAVLNG